MDAPTSVRSRFGNVVISIYGRSCGFALRSSEAVREERGGGREEKEVGYTLLITARR